MADRMTSGSVLRRDQATAVRERIVAAAVEVIEAGEEPTMRAVAHAAGIAERTLYRYYASREELHAALMPILGARASAPLATSVDGLADYVDRLFSTFDRNAHLARALVTAKWAPMSISRTANLRALRELVDAAFPKAPRVARESAVAALRVLYSGAAWAYLADCGMDVATSIRHVQWNTNTVLEELRRLSGGKHV